MNDISDRIKLAREKLDSLNNFNSKHNIDPEINKLIEPKLDIISKSISNLRRLLDDLESANKSLTKDDKDDK